MHRLFVSGIIFQKVVDGKFMNPFSRDLKAEWRFILVKEYTSQLVPLSNLQMQVKCLLFIKTSAYP